MITIKARALLSFTTEQLWTMIEGPFKLRFDNGEEIETNSKETL